MQWNCPERFKKYQRVDVTSGGSVLIGLRSGLSLESFVGLSGNSDLQPELPRMYYFPGVRWGVSPQPRQAAS